MQVAQSVSAAMAATLSDRSNSALSAAAQTLKGAREAPELFGEHDGLSCAVAGSCSQQGMGG